MNKQRVLSQAGALVVVVALVALALVAGRDGDGDEPRVLPVLSPASSDEAGTPSADDAELEADMSIAGRNEYVLPEELPALPDEAPAYQLADDLDEDDVRELAEVLGLEGDVEAADWGWSVADDDRTLDVQSGTGGSWSYYAVSEEEGEVMGHAETVPEEAEPEPVIEDEAEGPEEMPEAPNLSIDREVAERQGRELLAELGVDLDTAAVRVEDGWSTWIVSADPEIDGLPTIGFSASVAVGVGGVEYASGWLAPAEFIADYPLVGVEAAVERLHAQEQRWAEEATGRRAVEVWTFEVERVRLGLSLSSTYDFGSPAYLVPSYLLLTEDGWETTAHAVTDELLGDAPVSDEAPVDDDEHGDDEAPPGTAAETCTGQASAVAPGEAPEVAELQLCGPTTAEAGQTVTFRLTAEGRVRDDCASPQVVWGDGTDQAVCKIGCVALPTEAAEVVREVEHVYDEPGTYTVEGVLAGCPGGEQGRISAQIVVSG